MSARLRHLIALSLLAMITLAFFVDLFFSSDRVLSGEHYDLARYFAHWRKFGFEELARGNLALWNPRLYSGEPFFEMFQAALLYPLNLIYLILPLAKALNAEFAIHTFLSGALMYWWMTRRGLSWIACVMCGVLWMFCGARWLHAFGGHLPNLDTMTWAPLIFLVIDELFQRPGLRWSLVGMFAVAMTILAGHPQYVYYIGLAAGTYSLLNFVKARQRATILLSLMAVGVGGAALSAIQLLPGLNATDETIRSTDLNFSQAAIFSFPPENLLTLIAPGFFGNVLTLPYWGRWFFWEMSFFCSATALILAVIGAMRGEKSVRRFSVTMLVICVLVALGAHTPLFELLRKFLPGFAKFRGTGKFLFLASMFLIVLAGIGLDKLLREARLPVWLKLVPVAFALVTLIGAVTLSSETTPSWWQNLFQTPATNKHTYLNAAAYSDPQFTRPAAQRSAASLGWAVATFTALSVLLWLAPRWRRAVPLIALLATVEILFFAASTRNSFHLSNVMSPQLQEYLAARPGDYRILNTYAPNVGMSIGAQDIWGDDPAVLRRYAEFVFFTQGFPVDQVRQTIMQFKSANRLFRLLRCRYVMETGDKGLDINEIPDSLPRFQLVRKFRVEKDRDAIFAALHQPEFPLEKEIVLQRPPEPAPAVTGEGKIELLDSSTDHATLRISLDAPAILFATDPFSKNWKVHPLESAQAHYEILPADYCLQAIPLAAGKHVLRIEYVPKGFVAGKWISMISVLLFAALAGWTFRPIKSRK